MPSIIGNVSSGLKKFKDVFHKNKKSGLITAKDGSKRLAPGFTVGKYGSPVKDSGLINKAMRNPGTTAAIGAAALGGLYYYTQKSGQENAQQGYYA